MIVSQGEEISNKNVIYRWFTHFSLMKMHLFVVTSITGMIPFSSHRQQA